MEIKSSTTLYDPVIFTVPSSKVDFTSPITGMLTLFIIFSVFSIPSLLIPTAPPISAAIAKFVTPSDVLKGSFPSA